MDQTMKFQFEKNRDEEIRQILTEVYQALIEKGYNPISQLVGYILSGDPTYVTGYKNARALICKVERDELLEALMRDYLQKN